MAREKHTFRNSEGNTLAGLLELPDEGEARHYGIFAHCFTCSKNYKGIRNISRAMAANGIAMFSFDFAGLGESEGEFSETNFTSNVKDLLAAAGYLKKHFQAPGILLGHSMGGAAVLHAAAKLETIKAIGVIGSPASTRHLRTKMPQVFDKIEREGESEVKIGGIRFKLKRQFVRDLESHNMEQLVSNLDIPLIIVHSAADATVEIEHAEKLYDLARYPKALVTLDLADHLLSNQRDSQFVGEVISSWSSRYLKRGT